MPLRQGQPALQRDCALATIKLQRLLTVAR